MASLQGYEWRAGIILFYLGTPSAKCSKAYAVFVNVSCILLSDFYSLIFNKYSHHFLYFFKG